MEKTMGDILIFSELLGEMLAFYALYAKGVYKL